MVKRICALVLLCGATLFALNGSLELKLTPAFGGNDSIAGSEVPSVGVPVFNGNPFSLFNTTLDLNLLHNVGDFGLVFSMTGVYNMERAIYHDINELPVSAIDLQYKLNPFEGLIKYVDNLNLNLSGKGLNVSLGNLNFEASPMVVASRNIFGLKAAYKYDFDTAYKPSFRELQPFVEKLNNPEAPERFNLARQLEKEKDEPESFLMLQAGTGWAEIRDFQFEETNASNGLFNPDSDELDLYDNDLKDPARTFQPNEFFAGGHAFAKLDIFEIGLSAVRNQTDDEGGSSNSLYYPGAEYSFVKNTVGGRFAVSLDRNRFGISVGGAGNWFTKFTNLGGEEPDPAVTVSFDTQVKFDYAKYQLIFDLLWAGENFENGGSLGGATSDTTAFDLSFGFVPSEKIGTVGFDGGIEIDSDEPHTFIKEMPDKNFTSDYKLTLKGSAVYKKSFSFARVRAGFAGFNLSRQFLTGESTNTNGASWVKKIDWVNLNLSDIKIQEIKNSVRVKFTDYKDDSDSDKNYYFLNGALKTDIPLVPDLLKVRYGVSTSLQWYTATNVENRYSFEFVDFSAEVKRPKFKTGVTFKLKSTLDRQNEFDSGLKYQSRVLDMSALIPFKINLTSKFSLNTESGWVARFYKLTPLDGYADDNNELPVQEEYMNVAQGYGPAGTFVFRIGATVVF